jgi:hypothetical protein
MGRMMEEQIGEKGTTLLRRQAILMGRPLVWTIFEQLRLINVDRICYRLQSGNVLLINQNRHKLLNCARRGFGEQLPSWEAVRTAVPTHR